MPAPAMQIPMQIYTPIHVQKQKGLMLAELLVAVLLSAFLVMGLVQIVSAARSSFRLQENEAEVQENGRHAIATLGVLIRQAGFSPQPWNESFQSPALTPDTRDRVSSESDRLALRSWSNLNCFDNLRGTCFLHQGICIRPEQPQRSDPHLPVRTDRRGIHHPGSSPGIYPEC